MKATLRLYGIVLFACVPSAALPAQSLLDRSPNVSGNWVANTGTIQFNFLHRFTTSDPPARKVTNFPTFLLGAGLPFRTMVGLHYSTNSTLAPAFPNEWEFFARVSPLRQDMGQPFDLGGQVGYNVAAEGLDGEISVARRLGALRVIGLTRVLSNPYEAGEVHVAFGGGGTLRISRFVALAGDYVRLTELDEGRGEKPAWSAGVHVAMPSTPHTLSFQVSNTNTATLQGSSRGGSSRRYGFEFTVPITLARFFGSRGASARPTAPGDSLIADRAPSGVSGVVGTGEAVRTVIRSMTYPRKRIEIAVGTTIEWTNQDPLAHTVTADDGSFDSGLIQPGDKWRYTFTAPGTFDFYCTPHPFMKGVVVVKESP